MARIRTIKPEFFTSLTIADLSLQARLTFIGLWTHVDDEGRCVDDARLIKAAVWPLDDRVSAEVEGDLRALSESSLITRYQVDGRSYLAVRNWAEHQKINRPTKSRLPAPPTQQAAPPPAGHNSHAAPARSPDEQVAELPAKRLTEDSVSTPDVVPEQSGKTHWRKGSGIREQGSSSRPRRELWLITNATDADDDEAQAVIDEIRTRYRPHNLGGYLCTLARSGDLDGILGEVRQRAEAARLAERRREAIATLDPPVRLPAVVDAAEAAARAHRGADLARQHIAERRQRTADVIPLRKVSA